MIKNCIYLETERENLVQSLEESLVKLESFDFYGKTPIKNKSHVLAYEYYPYESFDLLRFLDYLISYQKYLEPLNKLELALEQETGFGDSLFIGETNEERATLALVAPAKITQFSPLPYLNYFISKKSPGTSFLDRFGFIDEIPSWFFRSTCTDLSLAKLARNTIFEISIKERKDQELELWYSMKPNEKVLFSLYKSAFSYSFIPIAILVLLNDCVILPILYTMSKIEIVTLYSLVVTAIVALALHKLVRMIPAASKSLREFLEYVLLMSAGTLCVFLINYLKTFSINYLIPNNLVIFGFMSVFYITFVSLNLYTIKRMPEILEKIFVKAMNKLSKGDVSK